MKYSKATVFVLIVAFLNSIYNATLPLHFDEAYYWLWSKNLALSYFDHPPMIAWLIKPITVFSDSEWALRLVPFFCMLMIAFVLWQLAKEAFNEEVADLTVVLYMVLPIVHIGFLLATPDAPLNLFWSLTLYAAYKAVFTGEVEQENNSWWLATGVFFGCALLSKYTAVLLLPALILAVLFSSRRKKIFSRVFLLATVAATIVFLPVIVWNYQHEWSSFLFQFNHGIAKEKVFSSKFFLEFFCGQAGILTPFVFLALLYATIRYLPQNLKNEKLAFFFWPFVLPILFFAHASMFKRSAANWAVPADLAGIILLSYWAVQKDWRKWKIVTIGFCILFVVMLKLPGLFPFLPAKMVLLNQLNGAPQVFADVKVEKDVVILTDNYSSAALAEYYVPNKLAVMVYDPIRFSMFDLWGKVADHDLADKALYVGQRDSGEKLQEDYAKVKKLPDMEYVDKYTKKRFFVYEVENPL